ncbi:MAG: AmmeMemoRadiSam system protein A [Actinomycetota bacterium]|nr:AmmeMemoRadiSam system protein A [Actinomycetota bacterium]
MSVAIGCVVPHPPILVPEVGRENLNRIQATVKGIKELTREIAKMQPETLVFISPHSPAFSDAIAIKVDPELEGSLTQFGASSISFKARNDLKLVEEILAEAQVLNIPTFTLSKELRFEFKFSAELDHGILVPLHYLRRELDIPLVSLSISHLSYYKHYSLGVAIQSASDRLNRRVAFIASGDLSHRLTPEAPGGYSPRGREFDHLVKDLLERAAFKDLLVIDKSLIEEAGECGLRSIIALVGAFNGYQVDSRVLSYEGPFGVGYLIALIRSLERDENRDFLKFLTEIRCAERKELREKESAPVRLAREAVEKYIREGKIIKPSEDLPDYLHKRRAGAFVSIKKEGTLRGCIGTTAPTQPNLACEIIRNAIHSATRDPRFWPIEPSELSDLVYSVDVLEEPEEIPDESNLDPREYGVIVESKGRTGLLLPDLEGVNTVEEQVAIARKKAGIPLEEPVKLYRFKVARYT